MKKILVTGGAGFIGSHIVDRLIAADNEVFVVDDLSSGFKENVNSQAKFCQLDIRSKEAAALVAEFAPNVIVHAAAQMSVRESMRDPKNDADINLLGLLNLLVPATSLDCRFVFLSTGGAIYGEQESFPAAETHQIKPDSIYGLDKYFSELYLDFWERKHALKWTALRLANVYGPRQNPHGEAGVVAIFYKRLLNGTLPIINGSGEQTRDFVYVKDVAEAVLAAVEKVEAGIYNIGTGIETSINDLYDMISKSLSLDVVAQRGPSQVGEQLRSVIDASKAKQVLAWEPEVQLVAGLKETAAWFKNN